MKPYSMIKIESTRGKKSKCETIEFKGMRMIENRNEDRLKDDDGKDVCRV